MQISLQANLDLLHTVKWVHFTGKEKKKRDPLKQKPSTTVDDIAQHIAEK